MPAAFVQQRMETQILLEELVDASIRRGCGGLDQQLLGVGQVLVAHASAGQLRGEALEHRAQALQFARVFGVGRHDGADAIVDTDQPFVGELPQRVANRAGSHARRSARSSSISRVPGANSPATIASRGMSATCCPSPLRPG